MGIDRGGERRDFYRLDQIKSACADLLVLMNIRADEKGFLSISDKRLGTIESLKEATGISDNRLRRLIKKRHLVPFVGLDRGNKRQNFYSLSDVEDAKNPGGKTRSDGLIEIEGVLCGAMATLTNILMVPKKTLRARIKKGFLRKYYGVDRAGCRRTLYFIDEVREKCVTPFVEMPRAGSSGMFVHDGKLWGTKEVLADKLNRSIDVIRRRIIVNDLQSLEGITRGGAARPFYMLDEVKRPAPNEATVRSRMGYTPVNAELLKLYADELVSAFFALRKKMPDLKSDMLWSAIKKKWYAPDLDRALKKAKRGDLKAFRQLLAE